LGVDAAGQPLLIDKKEIAKKLIGYDGQIV
jgi:hypothetical protein